MNERIFIVPATGLSVINPATREAIPAKGATVEVNTYWLRRLQDGDVLQPANPKTSARDRA